MSQPTNADEYRIRFAKNQRIEGFGLEVKTVLPCPFCAASDFVAMPITDPEKDFKNGAICKECGRSAKMLVKRGAPGEVSFEIVQTGGDDQPEWLTPPMRRA